jgi:hypothetical protein
MWSAEIKQNPWLDLGALDEQKPQAVVVCDLEQSVS